MSHAPSHERAVTAAHGHLPAVDGLRAIGALMVLLTHAAAIAGVVDGFLDRLAVGVPLFFAVSGFLLYRPWVAAAVGGRRLPGLGAYYWHRFLRVVPAYWVLVVASVVFFYPELPSETGRFMRIVLLQHIFVVGDMPYEQVELIGTLTPTWSVATEMHFYVLLPLLGYGLHRVLTARRGLLIACSLLVCLEAATAVWWTDVLATPFLEQTRWWWVFGYLRYFAVGMVLAALAARMQQRGELPAAVRRALRWPWAWWVVALAAHALGASLHLETLSLPSQYCDLIVVMGLLTPVVLASGRGPERMLRLPLPGWLGRISYGIFLWHMFVLLGTVELVGEHLGAPGPLRLLTLLAIVLPASILLGWLSFALIEKPLRRLRMRPIPAPRGDTPVPSDPRGAKNPV
ncbi:acyltransferase family protein [Streptomyces massasporeus]|uniref:Acyltransferase family protein n=1 Tax=Streptomyces massasporeus TaxID=67324 RepID=A0ABW6LT70_9ACTN